MCVGGAVARSIWEFVSVEAIGIFAAADDLQDRILLRLRIARKFRSLALGSVG